MNRMLIFFVLVPFSMNAAFGHLKTIVRLITSNHGAIRQERRTLFSHRTLEENVQLYDLIIKDLNQQKILLSSIHAQPKTAFKICLNILAHYVNPEFTLKHPLTWQPSPICIEIAKALFIARQERVMLRAHSLLQQEPQRSCECPRSRALAIISGVRTFEEDQVTTALARSYKTRLITADHLPECPFCE